AQQIVLLVVLAADAGLVGVLVEHDRPVAALGRDREQRVAARRHRLAGEGHVLAEGDLGRAVRAGAPQLVVGDQRAPDFASFDAGTAVVDADLGQADLLRDLGAWAGARQFQIGARGGGYQRHRRGESDGQSGAGDDSHVRLPPRRTLGAVTRARKSLVEMSRRRVWEPSEGSHQNIPYEPLLFDVDANRALVQAHADLAAAALGKGVERRVLEMAGQDRRQAARAGLALQPFAYHVVQNLVLDDQL